MEPDLPPLEDSPALIVPLVGESMSQTFATIIFFTSMMTLYEGAVLLARLAESSRLAQLQLSRPKISGFGISYKAGRRLLRPASHTL